MVRICDQKQNMPRGASALFLALMVTPETRKKMCAKIQRIPYYKLSVSKHKKVVSKYTKSVSKYQVLPQFVEHTQRL